MFIKRTSDAIEGISLSLINGTVSVMYNNGAVYRYTNVSRRAIANLMLNPNMSLGFWVNANCKNDRARCAKLYNAIPTVNGWAS
jgi:hypothetical protein